MPRQEPGIRRSCPLPYELVVDGTLSEDRRHFVVHFEAGDEVFGDAAAGCPFTLYARHDAGKVHTRNYAVAPGDLLRDSWSIRDFAGGRYQLEVAGPNGFYRGFRGDANDPPLTIRLEYSRAAGAARSLNGNIEVRIDNHDDRKHTIEIVDLAYKNDDQNIVLNPGQAKSYLVIAQRSFGWYDLRIRVAGANGFMKRYAGRVETGEWSMSDPAMGGVS
jgi:phospholipase C